MLIFVRTYFEWVRYFQITWTSYYCRKLSRQFQTFLHILLHLLLLLLFLLPPLVLIFWLLNGFLLMFDRTWIPHVFQRKQWTFCWIETALENCIYSLASWSGLFWMNFISNPKQYFASLVILEYWQTLLWNIWLMNCFKMLWCCFSEEREERREKNSRKQAMLFIRDMLCYATRDLSLVFLKLTLLFMPNLTKVACGNIEIKFVWLWKKKYIIKNG